jgi:hypothetical protein
MSKKPLGDFPEEKELIPEHIRRFLASLAQWVGWFGAFTLYLYSITQFNPSKGDFAPQWVGSTFIICLFVGIVGTLVRSRMRLSQTILAAFRAGVEIQRLRDEKNGNHHHE